MRRLPWTLYRYLGRELVLTFALSLTALCFLFLIVSSIQAVSMDFSLKIVFPWVLESMVYYLYFIVPVSLLFASTLVFGRSVAEREYTAIAAGGISPIHVFLPMALLAGAWTLVAFATAGTLFPQGHFRKRNIQRYLVQQLESLGEGRDREIPIGEKGRVYCEYHKDSVLHDVMIQKEVPVGGGGVLADAREEPNDEQPTRTVTVLAKYAVVTVDDVTDELVLTLTDIDILFEHPDSSSVLPPEDLEELTGWERISSTGLVVRYRLDEKAKNVSDKTTSELRISYDENRGQVEKLERWLAESGTPAERDETEKKLGAYRREQYKIESEIWRRYALALSCFSFAFLGFPISMTLRQRHRLVSFFLGVTLVLSIFYPLLLLGEKLVHYASMPAPLALLSGNAVLLLIAGFLTGRLFYR